MDFIGGITDKENSKQFSDGPVSSLCPLRSEKSEDCFFDKVRERNTELLTRFLSTTSLSNFYDNNDSSNFSFALNFTRLDG